MKTVKLTTEPRPRLIIAAAGSGSGKTIVASALAAALRRQALPVYPFKVGPDYIDPEFHSLAAGLPCRNLDSFLLTEDTLLRLFMKSSGRDGISVIEGVMGLFDGQGTGPVGSTAHTAELLKSPVILTVNAQGAGRSLAALVSGFANFSPSLSFGGVILNRVSGPAHYELLKACIEDSTGLPCLGFLPNSPEFAVPSRHLGLAQAGELPGLNDLLHRLAEAAARYINVESLLRIARKAPALPACSVSPPAPPLPRIRLGAAKDAAFSFYYEDNFDLLRSLGAEIVFFSPLRDAEPPKNLHGLYLGGGYPELFAEELSANVSMRSSLLKLLENGMPAYAECGGMLYLCASLAPDAAAPSERLPMVGFFSEEGQMTAKLQSFGYKEVRFMRDTVLGPAGTAFRAHEFHYSRLAEAPALPAFTAARPGKEEIAGGLARKNVFAGYPHIHFHSNPMQAENFISACRSFAAKEQP